MKTPIYLTNLVLASIFCHFNQILSVTLPLLHLLKVLKNGLNLDVAVHRCEFDSIGHEIEKNLKVSVGITIYQQKVVLV